MSDEEEEEYQPEWYPYEKGVTVGDIGPAHGFVLRDEEYGDPEDEEDADARVTLEQGRADNPGFFVTATLYGWLFHTQRLPDEASGTTAYEETRTELERLTEMLPYEEDRNVQEKVRLLTIEVEEFERKHPDR